MDALILCGGQGTRMGGLDKGWVAYQGIPLVVRALDFLKAQTIPPRRILISANRSLSRYQSLPYQVVSDCRPDFPGPLAGIEAALQASDAEWLFVMPCDTVSFPPTLIDSLLQVKNESLIRCPNVLGEVHPLPCLSHRSTLHVLQNQLDQNNGRVRDWQSASGVSAVPINAMIRNLNTPEDLNT